MSSKIFHMYSKPEEEIEYFIVWQRTREDGSKRGRGTILITTTDDEVEPDFNRLHARLITATDDEVELDFDRLHARASINWDSWKIIFDCSFSPRKDFIDLTFDSVKEVNIDNPKVDDGGIWKDAEIRMHAVGPDENFNEVIHVAIVSRLNPEDTKHLRAKRAVVEFSAGQREYYVGKIERDEDDDSKGSDVAMQEGDVGQ